MATTTNYGWETPDDTDLVKDGALAMRTTANSIDSTLGTALNNKLHAGLVLVKTQTILTAVTSVTVTDAFSANYDNYVIFIQGTSQSATDYINLQLRTGTTTAATNYYWGSVNPNYASSSSSIGASNTSSFRIAYGDSAEGYNSTVYLYNPFNSIKTRYNAHSTYFNTGGFTLNLNGFHNSATSYDQFVISPISGTLTGGTIYVYGYAKD